jgi:hypothetical protein
MGPTCPPAPNRRDTAAFLEDSFTSMAFDRAIARITADIRRTATIKLPDAAIAATALYTHTPVVTRNQRDFKRIPSLRPDHGLTSLFVLGVATLLCALVDRSYWRRGTHKDLTWNSMPSGWFWHLLCCSILSPW